MEVKHASCDTSTENASAQLTASDSSSVTPGNTIAIDVPEPLDDASTIHIPPLAQYSEVSSTLKADSTDKPQVTREQRTAFLCRIRLTYSW